MCTFVASRFHTHSAPRASQFVELLNCIAPDFTLESDSSEEITLSSLRGKTVVLYFYPKDDTPGCTQEACEFRDLFPRFKRGNAVILGIDRKSTRLNFSHLGISY